MEDERLIALLAGSNWPQLFDRKTLRQGREYAQRRCVSDFDMDQSHPRQTRIRANVLDGAPQSYQCSIELRPNPQAAFEISMRCSCPDATQCAHCVAALLEATQRHTGPVPLMLGEPVLANSDSVVTVSVTPKPVLSLRGAPFRSRARRGAERTIGVARLAFDYDGHRVPPDGRAASDLALLFAPSNRKVYVSPSSWDWRSAQRRPAFYPLLLETRTRLLLPSLCLAHRAQSLAQALHSARSRPPGPLRSRHVRWAAISLVRAALRARA